MKRHERDSLELIRSMATPHGCTVTSERGGKHLAVFVEHPSGAWHRFTVSGSPRDADCQINAVRQDVVAWLERAGLADQRGAAGVRKRKRHTRVRSRIWRIEVAIEPDDGPGRDPWAALSGFRLNGASDRAGQAPAFLGAAGEVLCQLDQDARRDPVFLALIGRAGDVLDRADVHAQEPGHARLPQIPEQGAPGLGE